MRYMGGKYYAAKSIAAHINEIRAFGQPYWEPFIGAASVASRIGAGLNLFSDRHEGLVRLLQAIRDGWIPPVDVTEAEYEAARDGQGSAIYRAFVGFACSYGAKWYAGYARGKGQNYASMSSYSLRRKVKRLDRHGRRPALFVADFLDPPMGLARQLGQRSWLIYCDPPYAGSTPYPGLPDFDNDLFWERAMALGEAGHTVLVSEYQAPEGWTQIWAKAVSKRLVDNGDPDRPEIAERLFIYDPERRLEPRTSAQRALAI